MRMTFKGLHRLSRLSAGAILLLPLLMAQAFADEAPYVAFTLDYRGDRLVRLSDEPTLTIYSDGRVVMPQIYSHSSAYDGQLSSTELQALTDYATKSGFFRQQAALSASAERDYRDIRYSHSATTILYGNDGSRSRSVSVTGLQHAAGSESLRGLRDKLEQIMATMRLGGPRL